MSQGVRSDSFLLHWCHTNVKGVFMANARRSPPRIVPDDGTNPHKERPDCVNTPSHRFTYAFNLRQVAQTESGGKARSVDRFSSCSLAMAGDRNN